MNDTTRRFLLAIIERLPPGDIVELRLFPAIRQGAIESGAAVIALEPALVLADPALDSPNDSLDASDALAEDTDAATLREEPAMVQGTLELESPVITITAAESEPERSETVTANDAEVASNGATAERETPRTIMFDDARRASAAVMSLTPRDEDEDDSPYRDDSRDDAEVAVPHSAGTADVGGGPQPNDADDSMVLGDILALTSPNGDDAGSRDAVTDDASHDLTSEEPASIKRYAILSARYRLTLKGPDRGKWDLELKHEADAPLATVERVARGVARRAGDESDPEHFSGESLRVALEAPAWATTP